MTSLMGDLKKPQPSPLDLWENVETAERDHSEEEKLNRQKNITCFCQGLSRDVRRNLFWGALYNLGAIVEFSLNFALFSSHKGKNSLYFDSLEP